MLPCILIVMRIFSLRRWVLEKKLFIFYSLGSTKSIRVFRAYGWEIRVGEEGE